MCRAGEEKLWWGSGSDPQYLKGGYGDGKVKLYTKVHEGNTTDTGHKLELGKFRLAMRKTFPL